jgi:ABC-type branched-subunit amino acid transport system substrate-binding protein
MQLTTGGIVAASKVSPSRARAGTGPTSSAVIDDQNEFVVGLLVPINGSAGIWGPSSIACAQLAQAEINADAWATLNSDICDHHPQIVKAAAGTLTVGPPQGK